MVDFLVTQVIPVLHEHVHGLKTPRRVIESILALYYVHELSKHVPESLVHDNAVYVHFHVPQGLSYFTGRNTILDTMCGKLSRAPQRVGDDNWDRRRGKDAGHNSPCSRHSLRLCRCRVAARRDQGDSRR